MPQFFLYAKYANEQKAYQLNLITVNDYLQQIFKKDTGRPIKKGPPTITECKQDHHRLINNMENLAMARDSLKAKTGRTEFDLREVIREIELLDKESRALKYKVNEKLEE